MSRVALAVTGSVAAIRTPLLADGLRLAGHDLVIIATEPSLYFFDHLALDAPAPAPGGRIVLRDRDEWPNGGYTRDLEVLHIELRRWADLLVVAPLDANTLTKLAVGLADNLLSCLLRAWDFSKPVVLAPAMNTVMWESPITRRHLDQLLSDRGDGLQPKHWPLESAGRLFEAHAPGITLVGPIEKRLACGDLGIGGMAEVPQILDAVDLALRRTASAGDQDRRTL